MELRRTSTPSHFPPLAVWLGLQLLVLIVAAAQIPLSDQFPRPPHRLALDEMLVVQTCAAAMLFPLLLRTINAAVLTIAASWPFLQLAAVLSVSPAANTIVAGAYLAGWLLILAISNSFLRSEPTRLIGVATATAAALGGALMWYLRTEFADPSTYQLPSLGSLMGPVIGILVALHGQAGDPRVWLPLVGVLSLVSVFALIAYARRRIAPPEEKVVNS